jgi:predicted transcriptional regulator
MTIAHTRKEPCPTCGHPRKRWNGAYLRSVREASDKSLRALARDAGLSASFVSDVELNRRNLNVALLQAYRRLLYWGNKARGQR